MNISLQGANQLSIEMFDKITALGTAPAIKQ
jgi:hypothetical protein